MPAKDTTRREPWNPLLKSYPFSERVNAVSVGAETLFTRLIAQADDYGNFYGEPRKLLAYLYGHRFAAKQVSETDAGRWRAELVSNPVGPLAAMYNDNGSEYIHIINSRRRLRSDVQPDERFPREPASIEENALSEHVTRTARTRNENDVLDLDPDKTKTKTKKNKRADLETEFAEIFWPAIPNKLGKGKAREAFVKARGKVSLETIMAGVPGYVTYETGRRTQKDYRPLHPATWLNQERWDDEVVNGATENGDS
ncbi:MAG: hypothetical protein KAY24_17725, partial [Candidatus Eisenbacteria sp.]|nr:hypothetical protein [Candidatus Eisenbacteria bacterium]